MQTDTSIQKALLRVQKAEATGCVVYRRMARFEKHDKHVEILSQIASEEREHYDVWKQYTGRDVTPDYLLTTWYTLLFFLCGYTFVLRLMQKGEDSAVESYTALPAALPELQKIIKDEEEHENLLISILDEERLKYMGAIVLGLNDALVELTGSIAGFTFALANTRLIAMAGIITGISATLSMSASNYLAERENNNPNALKASVYTGAAYLVTVIALIIPYLVFPEESFLIALVTMLGVVVLIILLFNYYVSVAQCQPFWSRFGRMAAISLGVAVVSFLIGIAAKALLGIDV